MSGAGFISSMIQTSKSNLSLKKNIRKKYGRELQKIATPKLMNTSNNQAENEISQEQLLKIKAEWAKYRQKQNRKEKIEIMLFVMTIIIFSILLCLYINNY